MVAGYQGSFAMGDPREKIVSVLNMKNILDWINTTRMDEEICV
jgi:hypothetical protein